MFRTEGELIAWVQTHASRQKGALRLGIGDDAAVVRPAPGRDLLLKSDMSIERIHFDNFIVGSFGWSRPKLSRAAKKHAKDSGTANRLLVRSLLIIAMDFI